MRVPTGVWGLSTQQSLTSLVFSSFVPLLPPLSQPFKSSLWTILLTQARKEHWGCSANAVLGSRAEWLTAALGSSWKLSCRQTVKGHVWSGLQQEPTNREGTLDGSEDGVQEGNCSPSMKWAWLSLALCIMWHNRPLESHVWKEPRRSPHLALHFTKEEPEVRERKW